MRLSPSRSWEAPGCRCCSCWSALRTLLLIGNENGGQVTKAVHLSVHGSFNRVVAESSSLSMSPRQRHQALSLPQTSSSRTPPCRSWTRAPLILRRGIPMVSREGEKIIKNPQINLICITIFKCNL